MKIGVMLTVTGFAMIVMSWTVPIGGILIIFGALASAIALDEVIAVTDRDAVARDAQLEVPDAA